MNKMDEQFSARIEELLNHAEGGTVFFFKGFALPQIKQLLEHPHALLKAPELIETGNLNLPALNEKWLELAEAFRSAPKPAVGFYEELLAIRELLPRLNAKAICIVENNALSPWEPCLFPMADALALFDYQQQEKDPVSPELDLLTHYYGDVRILNGEKALVLPFTPEGPELKTVPFWAETPVPTETDASLLEHGTAESWLFRLELLEGKGHPVQLTEDLREAGLAKKRFTTKPPSSLCSKNIGAKVSLSAPCFFIKIPMFPGKRSPFPKGRSWRKSPTSAGKRRKARNSETFLSPPLPGLANPSFSSFRR